MLYDGRDSLRCIYLFTDPLENIFIRMLICLLCFAPVLAREYPYLFTDIGKIY